MSGAVPVLEFTGVQKQYGALRPLRIQALRVDAGQSVAILGLDRAAAEVFVNLVTGSTLPDQGEVRAFGQPTGAITDSGAWLSMLERFGILSERAVLLDGMTVAQNLAMTFTLEVDPIPPGVRGEVEALARSIGLDTVQLDRPVGAAAPDTHARVRLGRAIALGAELLLLEHPTATLAPHDVPAFAADLRRVAADRSLTMVSLTADRGFASMVSKRVLTLAPGTGALTAAERPLGKVRRFFGKP